MWAAAASMPDFDKLVGLYQQKGVAFRGIENALMGAQDYPENFHQALFTAEHLSLNLTAQKP